MVVLQEDLPETTIADFKQFATRFVAEAREARARPVLLMAWSYKRLGWISQAEIARAHREIERDLKVDVAPVGTAWERARALRPSIALLGPDGEHPSLAGSYLATGVIYATIYNTDLSRLEYTPRGLAPDDAAVLRRVAWESVLEWRAGAV